MLRRVQIVRGISGVALPVAQKAIVWSRPMLIEGMILFAQNGNPATTAALAVEIFDEDAHTIFQDGEGSTFLNPLMLNGIGPTIYFPAQPRWFAIERYVVPGDVWQVHVTGPGGAVPIVAWRTIARDADMYNPRVA